MKGLQIMTREHFFSGYFITRQAEENRRVSKSQYEVGLETLSDHLEAQALWQQAYETQVDARFQLYLNYVAYLKAAGTLHDKL